MNRQDAEDAKPGWELNRQDARDAKVRMFVDEMAGVVVDASIEVHRHLGPGFLEAVYEDALAHELKTRGVRFERQVPFSVRYKEAFVGNAFIDLFIEEMLVVELKAVTTLLPIHTAQAMSYLKATKLPLALLLNFNTRLMRDGIRRVALRVQ
jgi:GxxExxY protein